MVGGGFGIGSALMAEARRGHATARRATAPGDRNPEAADVALDEHVMETMVAFARVVYPSALSGIDEFVQTYLDRRVAERPAHAAIVAEMVARLDGLAREWHGEAFTALAPGTRDRLLREVGADTAIADPEGTTAQRVRYYLVNELLFALYASPAGGELVGLENPQGHPGGLDSYQRGPRG